MKMVEISEDDVTANIVYLPLNLPSDCFSVWKYAAAATPPVTGIESRGAGLTLLALVG